MSNNIEYKKSPGNGKAIAGVILLVVGGVLLLRQLDLFFFPGWLFSWPMWLILPGIYIGAKSNFQKPTWFILVALGFAFLADEALSGPADRAIWPCFFIVIGIWLILRRNNKRDDWKNFGQNQDKKTEPFSNFTPPPAPPVVDYRVNDVPPVQPQPQPDPVAEEPAAAPNPFTTRNPYNDDHIDVTAVFGGVDKIVLSKNFKGGEIVNIFGGTEIDFTKADISGQVILEITQVFGGTKLIIPPHWHVISDIASIFAGLDDKRMRHTTTVSNEKVLIIKGTSIFAGIDIRSY